MDSKGACHLVFLLSAPRRVLLLIRRVTRGNPGNGAHTAAIAVSQFPHSGGFEAGGSIALWQNWTPQRSEPGNGARAGAAVPGGAARADGAAAAGRSARVSLGLHVRTRDSENGTEGRACAHHMKAFSLRAFSFGCFESLFSVALFKLVFNLLFSLWASFIFLLLYQKRLDFIPIPALLAFWSLISF